MNNASSEDVECPLLLVVDSISVPGITLNNPDGATPDGKPYFDLSDQVGEDGVLSPGESTTPVTISFNNPSRSRFSFESSCLGVVVLATPPAPTLDPHLASTNQSSMTIEGTALQAVEVEVSGPEGVQNVPVGNDERFSVNVPLHADLVNHIFCTSIDATGVRCGPA